MARDENLIKIHLKYHLKSSLNFDPKLYFEFDLKFRLKFDLKPEHITENSALEDSLGSDFIPDFFQNCLPDYLHDSIFPAYNCARRGTPSGTHRN